jgi:hypothetical protein
MTPNLAITPIVKFVRDVTLETSDGRRVVVKGTLAMVQKCGTDRAEVLVESSDGRRFVCLVEDGDVEPV